jgi:hypothetical protein
MPPLCSSSANQSTSGHYYQIKAPDTDIGYASLDIYHALVSRGQTEFNGIDWSKTVTFGWRAIRKVGSGVDNASEMKMYVGKSYNTTGVTNRLDPSAGDKAVGIKQVGNGALMLWASNGSSVFNTTTSFTPTNLVSYDVVIEVAGGTAKLFVNDILVATLANAPTSYGGTQCMALWATCENTAVLTGSNHSMIFTDYFLTQI